ncbi:hypothetical protein DIPPA_11561 [Diplonema papillatum]|nr:hypothetical protein DIPPA_11561 [Diplonema papillatum]
MYRRTALFAWMALLLVSVCRASMECTDQCRPWAWAEPNSAQGRLACKKDNDMDFRMILGDYYANETDNPFLRDDMPYKTYFFCPRVDSFSAFVLDDSLSLLNGSHTATYYLSAFGAGKSSEVHIPVPSQDAVVPVWEPNHHRCLGNQSAVATFLLFNLTLKDGDYTYKNADPIGTGFVNTCTDDGETCHFDSSSFCIGSSGRYNCAQCADSAEDLRVFIPVSLSPTPGSFPQCCHIS